MSEEKKEELHPVVELLIKRMESNPEEFKKGDWMWVDRYTPRHFTPVEATAFNEALRKLHMDELHERVMKQILAPEQPDDLYKAASSVIYGGSPVVGTATSSSLLGGIIPSSFGAATTSSTTQQYANQLANQQYLNQLNQAQQSPNKTPQPSIPSYIEIIKNKILGGP